MKKCKKCGIENQENAKFCNECGCRLDKDTTLAENNDNSAISPVFISTEGFKNFKTFIRHKRKVIILSFCSIALVIVLSMFNLNNNNDFKKAKHYFQKDDIVSLLELKVNINREDWNQFEEFLFAEAESILVSFNNNEIEAEEAKTQIEKIVELSSKNISKGTLLKEFENLHASKEAFKLGLTSKEENDALKAYESFKSVISLDTEYEQAQAYIEELKPVIVAELIEKSSEEYKAEKYSEALETINSAIKLDDQNNELQMLKNQYETSKAEADEKIKEEAKRKAEEAEAAKALKSGKVIKTETAEIEFVDAKFATKILPDDTSGSYLYYSAESDEIFLDIKFKVKNIGKYELKLEGLVSNVLAKYGDGYTYQSYSCFWTEKPGDISNVYSWDELDPLKTTTYHLALKLPREVADSENSLSVTFKIAEQEQVLNIR